MRPGVAKADSLKDPSGEETGPWPDSETLRDRPVLRLAGDLQLNIYKYSQYMEIVYSMWHKIH